MNDLVDNMVILLPGYRTVADGGATVHLGIRAAGDVRGLRQQVGTAAQIEDVLQDFQKHSSGFFSGEGTPIYIAARLELILAVSFFSSR